jgi:hypothetical protein
MSLKAMVQTVGVGGMGVRVWVGWSVGTFVVVAVAVAVSGGVV